MTVMPSLTISSLPPVWSRCQCVLNRMRTGAELLGEQRAQSGGALGGAAVDHDEAVGARQHDDVAAGAADLNEPAAQRRHAERFLGEQGTRVTAQAREQRSGAADGPQKSPAAAFTVLLAHRRTRHPLARMDHANLPEL
jgi:hypothetical protein